MKSSCKLSIIIPVYNIEKYITQCLDSIVNQKGDFEVIIINDGSNDGSDAICKQYSKNFVNVKYYITTNNGLSAARNYGLSKSSGEYVWFVDGDDYVANNSIEKVISESSKHDILVINYYKHFESDNTDELFTPKIIKDPIRRFLIGQQMAPMKIIKRSLLVNNAFSFPSGRLFEDLGSMYKLASFTNDFYFSNLAPYYYRMRGGSITKGLSDKNIEDRYWAIDEIRKNIPKQYFEEAEYQAIINIPIFLLFLITQYRSRDYRRLANEAYEYMKDNFPNYKNNRYINDATITNRWHRILLWFFRHRLLFVCKLITIVRNKRREKC